jgi:hypothetical protein
MNDVLYLAWRYLRFNRGKAAVLVGSISLILFLPAALQVVVREAARALTARADATPLLLGARGSAVDLTLGALYFREPSLDPTSYGVGQGDPAPPAVRGPGPPNRRNDSRLPRLPKARGGVRTAFCHARRVHPGRQGGP